MNLPIITNSTELEKLVEEIGFLPMFRSSIEGFSLEDCTPKKYWFVKGVEGPWEWREQIAEKGNIAYAKLFNKKAGFVNLKWYPEIANYRRDGYDFDSRYEDGLASRQCKIIIDLLTKHDSLLSPEIKSYGSLEKRDLRALRQP